MVEEVEEVEGVEEVSLCENKAQDTGRRTQGRSRIHKVPLLLVRRSFSEGGGGARGGFDKV